MAKVILTSDDFGMSTVYNAEILNALASGFLSSVSIMVNRGALKRSQVSALLQLYRKLPISLGLHLELGQADVFQQCVDQWEKFERKIGVFPDYVDIHKDHIFTADYDKVATFCVHKHAGFRKYAQTTVKVNSPDRTLIGTYLKQDRILKDLDIIKPDECYEIVFHIGKFDSSVTSSLNKEREDDLFKLRTVKRQLTKKKIQLANYKMI